MKRVLTAVVLVLLTLLLVYVGPLWMVSLVITAAALVCLYEYSALIELMGFGSLRRVLYCLVLFCFVPGMIYQLATRFHFFGQPDYGLDGYRVAPYVLLLSPVLIITTGLHAQEVRRVWSSAALSLLGLCYVVGGLFPLLYWRTINFDVLIITYFFISVWSGDIFAYYFGKSFGKHKLAPTISPNKSWEGTIASVIAAVGFGTIFLRNLDVVHAFLLPYNLVPPIGFVGWSQPLPHFPVGFCVLAGILINVAAQIGDLAESALKRAAGVKDSGSFLPGHGGLLDRVDAMLFAAPVAMLVLGIGLERYTPKIWF